MLVNYSAIWRWARIQLFLLCLLRTELAMSKEHGDMLGLDQFLEARSKKGSKFLAADKRTGIWNDGIVKYFMENNFTVSYANNISSAMNEISRHSCVKFDRVTEPQRDTLRIQKRAGVCQATVGKSVDEGIYHMDLDEGECPKGVIIHELMHVIGFVHEHQRTDRDAYVTIYLNRVQGGVGVEKNFEMLKVLDITTPYDYGSIMQYETTAFGYDGQETIAATQSLDGKKLGQRDQLSPYDIVKINRLYTCYENEGHCEDKLGAEKCKELSMKEYYCEKQSDEKIKETCMKECGKCPHIKKRKERPNKNKKKKKKRKKS